MSTAGTPLPALRRNDLVLHESATAWFVPARVVRRVDAGHVAILDTLGRPRTVPDGLLRRASATECEGAPDPRNGRIRPMPTLRRLKQNAAWYEPGVWATDRRSRARRLRDAASATRNAG